MINKRFDERYNIFNGVKNVSSEIFQIYPVFIPAKKFIKYFSFPTWIDSWKSNEISEENIENITKSDSNFAQTFVDHHILPDRNFNGHCLINNIYILRKVINVINIYDR